MLHTEGQGNKTPEHTLLCALETELSSHPAAHNKKHSEMLIHQYRNISYKEGIIIEVNNNHINLPVEGLATRQTECIQHRQAGRLCREELYGFPLLL